MGEIGDRRHRSRTRSKRVWSRCRRGSQRGCLRIYRWYWTIRSDPNSRNQLSKRKNYGQCSPACQNSNSKNNTHHTQSMSNHTLSPTRSYTSSPPPTHSRPVQRPTSSARPITTSGTRLICHLLLKSLTARAPLNKSWGKLFSTQIGMMPVSKNT